MAKIIAGALVLIALIAAGVYMSGMMDRGGENNIENSGENTPSAQTSDSSNSIAADLDAAAVADIDGEFSEIDSDINSL
jgi:hypothetical protein